MICQTTAHLVPPRTVPSCAHFQFRFYAAASAALSHSSGTRTNDADRKSRESQLVVGQAGPVRRDTTSSSAGALGFCRNDGIGVHTRADLRRFQERLNSSSQSVSRWRPPISLGVTNTPPVVHTSTLPAPGMTGVLKPSGGRQHCPAGPGVCRAARAAFNGGYTSPEAANFL